MKNCSSKAITATMNDISVKKVNIICQFLVPTRTEAEHNLYSKMTLVEQEVRNQKIILGNILESIDDIDSTQLLIDIRNKIDKKLHRNSYLPHRYYKTNEAAAYISVDPSFLTKKQDDVFIEGKHFHRPDGSSILRWDIEALDRWMQTSKSKEDENAILDKMLP